MLGDLARVETFTDQAEDLEFAVGQILDGCFSRIAPTGLTLLQELLRDGRAQCRLAVANFLDRLEENRRAGVFHHVSTGPRLE